MTARAPFYRVFSVVETCRCNHYVFSVIVRCITSPRMKRDRFHGKLTKIANEPLSENVWTGRKIIA